MRRSEALTSATAALHRLLFQFVLQSCNIKQDQFLTYQCLSQYWLKLEQLLYACMAHEPINFLLKRTNVQKLFKLESMLTQTFVCEERV